MKELQMQMVYMHVGSSKLILHVIDTQFCYILTAHHFETAKPDSLTGSSNEVTLKPFFIHVAILW